MCLLTLSDGKYAHRAYIYKYIYKQGMRTRKQNKSLIAPNAIRAIKEWSALERRAQRPTHTTTGFWWKSDAVERQTRAIPSRRAPAPGFMADADNCFLIWIRVAGLSISSAKSFAMMDLWLARTPAPWLNINTLDLPRIESRINSKINLWHRLNFYNSWNDLAVCEWRALITIC